MGSGASKPEDKFVLLQRKAHALARSASKKPAFKKTLDAYAARVDTIVTAQRIREHKISLLEALKETKVEGVGVTFEELEKEFFSLEKELDVQELEAPPEKQKLPTQPWLAEEDS